MKTRPELAGPWVPSVATALIMLGALFWVLVLPVGLLVLGLMALWFSPLWTTTEKILGTVVPILGLGPALVSWGFVVAATEDGGTPWLVYVVTGAVGMALASLFWLAVVGARRHKAFELGAWPAS